MSDEPTTQALQTRRLLLAAAEELFAARGIAAVSNRQICEAAGQGNNYAVGYHFGNRDGLLSALLEVHNEPIEQIRARMVDDLSYITEVRDWLRCLVQPQLEYLGTAPRRTHFAALCAQLAVDPENTSLIHRAAAESSSLRRILDGLYASLPPLPETAVTVRNLMTQHLLISMFASFENSRNASEALDHESWRAFSAAVVDGLIGLWLAPAT
ncbi:putative TetR family transcriptional regulator [Gordonia hirsuta DSM 44140 = NBRC 16056]|uniref:Putative TetR family transcriptional regulator n=1 Tax=Gordonia hirsuta DSM 44140 = NBRC 16056 TaxID=1121927 RepID=L7LBJ5_9ACTN|nr:TetR family transcriptional regulator [Gordonia hirsuta]GAC58480.1 putative TetR family transcriptional regulator [Gordonia hirsuta DSM 44140 = NBRC 16056]